jgi:hypothetical protein
VCGRVPGVADLAVGDERVHVGDGGDHRGVAAEGRAGAQLLGGVGGRQRAPGVRAPYARAPARLPALAALLPRAAAAQGAPAFFLPAFSYSTHRASSLITL